MTIFVQFFTAGPEPKMARGRKKERQVKAKGANLRLLATVIARTWQWPAPCGHSEKLLHDMTPEAAKYKK